MIEQQSSKDFLQECSICCQTKLRSNSVRDQIRPLQICYDCWYNHIKNVVERISYRVGDKVLSPFNLGEPIDIITCINSLLPMHSQKIQESLFRKYNSFTKDIEKCPAQACDYVYVGQKCQWRSKQNIYNCPKCDTLLTTQNTYSITRFLTSFYLLLSNKCPKCSIPIQKIKGCPHMTCPCGHHFCWYCYKDHPSGGGVDRVYHTHTISQCSFIFLSKFILLFFGVMSIIIASQGRTFVDWLTGIFGMIFSILWRVILVDGTILAQGLIIMMIFKKKRGFRSNNYSNKFTENKGSLFILLLINLVILGLLLYFNELKTCMIIMLGQILVVSLCFALGYAIVYSIETWFQYIA